MLQLLERWNRWGTNALNSGVERSISQKLHAYLKRKEILALLGPRRAGKTTVMYQLMDYLEASGHSKESILHINFEEPMLADKLNLDTLELLYTTYRQNINPSEKAFLFLDEIQNIPQWEKWVRARSETDNIKIILTGSSASLLSSELSTVLTGRHFAFTIYPLDFKEFLNFKSIPEVDLTKRSLRHDVAQALNEYLIWGGYPEVTLENNKEIKHHLLSQYLDDTLYKDVAMRFEIRDIATLKALAVHLLTQSGSLITSRRLAAIYGVSPDRIRKYCDYLQQAFIVGLLPYFSLKAAERNRNPHKVYAIDNGIRQLVSISASADRGRMLETTAYQSLLRQHAQKDLYYWKGKQEIDFLVYEQSVSELLQVAQHLNDEKVWLRETNALAEANLVYPKANQTLIVEEIPTKSEPNNLVIEEAWRYLLNKH